MTNTQVERHSQQHLERENQRLRETLADLQSRLKEPEEIIRAIRHGEVDAFVVTEQPGERIYTLRSADLLYRMLIEEMQEGALALDENGLILYCNWHFAGLMRKERERILGTRIFSFVPPESRSVFEMLKTESPSGACRAEVCLTAADGTSVPVLLTINPIRSDGLAVFCLIVTDLTEQKRQRELLAVSQRKDIFLAMLSHELRNPIAPIRNAAHVLRLQNLSPADTRWAGEIIERQVLQLTRLVDDLLDVARINSGKIHLRMCDVDLRGAIAAAVEETRPNVDSRRHDLRVDLTDGPLMVHGDASRLTQVLANLLSNAAKFTPNGGRIWVTAERREQECFVRVRDSGIGIPAETLPRVFEFFVQADTSVGRPHDGLGIGLALVKTLVEMHGGQVAVTSPGPGKGAEFSLRLPLVAEQPDAQPGVAAISQPVAAGAACRVLVVDDNRDSAESLARLIRQWGHDVCVATCGADGLELARKEPFDVAFMDIGMPQATGYEVARQMRQLPGMDRAVLVAVTGYGQEEDCRQSREAGFDHHWVKPTNVVAVEELLRSRKP